MTDEQGRENPPPEPRPDRSARRNGRVLALQALYESDLAGHDPLASLAREEGESQSDEEAMPFASEEASAYARLLVEGVLENRDPIDRVIARSAPAWPLEQLPAVDRNLLRLAIYELLFDNRRVPPKVAINEAVEIAKTFGSENSSRFVNGVLGTVVAGRAKRA
jgi:N utilization substance protein B